MSYRKYLMADDVPPSELYKTVKIDPDSDTISRQAAIEALDKRFDSIPMEQTSEILMLRKDLRELPPAQPEPYTDALKAEIKRMKRSFTICINSDYYTGYMSALSAVEGYIAQMEVTT